MIRQVKAATLGRLLEVGRPDTEAVSKLCKDGETFSADYCELCKVLQDGGVCLLSNCRLCPLESCGAGTLYSRVRIASTWPDWTVAAEKMLARLEDLTGQAAVEARRKEALKKKPALGKGVVDLLTCKIGDNVRRRDGKVAVFLGQDGDSDWFRVNVPGTSLLVRRNGLWSEALKESSFDVVEILGDAEVSKPTLDETELVELCGGWQLPHKEHPTLPPGHRYLTWLELAEPPSDLLYYLSEERRWVESVGCGCNPHRYYCTKIPLTDRYRVVTETKVEKIK